MESNTDVVNDSDNNFNKNDVPASGIPATESEIAAANAYELLHVPALFGQWAPRVVNAAGIRPGQRVLDVACGTGALAREAALRTGNGGFVAGIDPDPGMLCVAAQHAPLIEWSQGLAESLPYDDNSFDALISQFGLMFFQNKSQAIREMLRVLAPGGRMVVAVWESLENSQAYPLEVELLERFAGQQAADALRAPFVLGDKTQLQTLFSDSGAESIEINTHRGRARFPTIQTMVEADLRGWLPIMGVHLDETMIETILKEAEQILARYQTAQGTIEFDSPAHIVTCSKK